MAENQDIFISPESLQVFYSAYFDYYLTLNTQWKNTFVQRCIYFINNKLITGAEGFVPDNRVKAIIAASAIQLTLGLEKWKLGYFDTIIIHPGDFDDEASGLRFRGETNLGGYIRLSWKSFISGYRVGDDNVNLGLHEFTHALRFNPVKGYAQDYFVKHYFNAWLASANEAYEDLRQAKESVFRKYGGTNINEFLSVCIEHFFESPQEIKNRYPFLYYSTAILLNQYSVDGKTEIGIREKLFNEKNRLIKMEGEYRISTKWNRTNSFYAAAITSCIWLYTMLSAGFMSGVSLFLLVVIAGLYFHFDFYYTSSRISGRRFALSKGFLIFRHRRKVNIPVSQMISVKLYSESEHAECDIIYFDQAEDAFYEENIPSGKSFPKALLSSLFLNKIAIFRG